MRFIIKKKNSKVIPEVLEIENLALYRSRCRTEGKIRKVNPKYRKTNVENQVFSR